MKSGGGQSPFGAYAVMGLQWRQNFRLAVGAEVEGGAPRSKAERGGAEYTAQWRRAQAEGVAAGGGAVAGREAGGAAGGGRHSGGAEGATEL